MDYVDPDGGRGHRSERSRNFVRTIEQQIGHKIALLGYGPDNLEANEIHATSELHLHDS